MDPKQIQLESSEPTGYKNFQLGGQQRKGYFRIDALQKDVKDYETKFITTFEYNSSGSRCFFVFEDYIEFIQSFLILQKNKGSLYFHEFILGYSPFRMYFDIDCSEITRITKEDLLSDFIDAIGSYFKDQDIDYPKERISVCSCHTEIKHSYHVIFPDISIPDVFTMKMIGKEIKQRMEYGKYLDCSYQNNKNFRLPFNLKYGKQVPITFEEKWYYDDELVNFKFQDNAHPIVKIFEESIVNCFTNTKYILPSQIRDTETFQQNSFSVNLSEIYQLQDELRIPKGLEIIEGQKTNLIVLRNKNGFDCPICKRSHEKENAYLFINQKGIYFKCFRNNQQSLLLKQNYKPPPNSYIHTFKELIKDKFVDILPKKCSKLTDVFQWNEEKKLWETLQNDILCSKISNLIQEYSDEVIKGLEDEKQKIIQDMIQLKSEMDDGEQSRKQLIGKGRPRAENLDRIEQIKLNIQNKEDEYNKLKAKTKDYDGKIKIWSSYQKESSRSEYHLKIIQEIVSRNFNKEILNKLDKLQAHIPIKDGKIVNLKTQQILERTKEHYFTFESDILFNPNVSKYADKVLSQIMCRDEEMVKCLKKSLAYGCFGTNDQKKIFVFYGPQGHNGKSVVFTMMNILLGPLFGDINQTLFKEKEARANKPELLALEKKRFTQITELKKEDKMDITFLKTISGRDVINLRDNYSTSEEVKDILFDFVIYMMTNSFPDVVPDEALWRRFLFFPFDAKFTSDKEMVNEENHIYPEDRDLIEKFKHNDDYKSSVLNMILEGSRLFLEEGFTNIPDKCKDKTEGMKLERAEDQDPLTLFLGEEFVVRDNSKKIERAKFNHCVAKYSKIKFNKCYKPGEINESMRQKGFTEKKSDGIFYFLNIDLNINTFNIWVQNNSNIM
jgi:phage/plasmid-associated DNA primase